MASALCSRPLRRCTALVPTLLRLALIAALLPAAAAAEEISPYGVNVHAPAGAQLVTQLDRVEAAGMGWIRIDFIWAAVERQPGVYDWQLYDNLVAAAEKRGIDVLAILAYTPQWATDGAEISGVPRNNSDWTRFCTKAAQRYRGRIKAWELWNEPNLPRFWAGSREEYWSRILIPGADAIHAADPGARVAGPGLAHLQSADWHHWLLGTLQAAGDRLDVVTHHVYDADGYADTTQKLDGSTPFANDPELWNLSPPSVREVLKLADARDKPFWLTETGWESTGRGRDAQATNYRGWLGHWFTGSATRSWIAKVFFYELIDGDGSTSWGLLDAGATGKPSYRAVRDFIAAHPTSQPLLLQDSRFSVAASWRTPDGQAVPAVPVSYSRESGRFWFFGGNNIELVVKVLDGRPVNGKAWILWGALSDVEYWITLTDRQTGAVRRYHNRPGTFCGGADTSALPLRQAMVVGPEVGALSAPEPTAGAALSTPLASGPLALTGSAATPAAFELPAALAFDDLGPANATSAAAASCVPGPGTLCLSNRFRVEARWRDQRNGGSGNATAVAGSGDSGYFWFFASSNLELAVKVLDGRGINGKHWVFFGALSDVEYWVTVTDTQTGAQRTYHNAPGTLCGQADTGAF